MPCFSDPGFSAHPGAPGRSGSRRGLDPSRLLVVEHTLANGLNVRLLPEPGLPTITYYTFFKVGSRNERPGITGISHLFEHMMFNGSARFGPKEFDRLLEARGGTSNAYTSSDVTAYYEDFDRDALELVVDLESDRMRALTIDDECLKREREVVKEERRYRVDNDLGGMMDELLDATAFVAHSYHWPVVGWMGDLDAITKAQCIEYFRAYYAPNNAVMVLVGDLEPEPTLRLIEEHYHSIPAGPPLPGVVQAEPEQHGERYVKIRHAAQAPALALAYKAVEARHADAAALDLVQTVLSIGEGARLSRVLVRKKEVATSALAYFDWRIDPSTFKVSLELPPEGDPARALQALDEEVVKLQTGPLPAAELERAKNLLRGQTLRALATHNGKAHALGEHEVLHGSWRALFQTLERYEQVTADDVRAAARRYLVPERRSVVELVPVGEAVSER